MKSILYSPEIGASTVILHPAPEARLCSGVVLTSEVVEFAPMPFFAVVQQWPNAIDFIYAETEEAFIDRICAKDVPTGAVNVCVVDEADIPADRSFRDAWRHDKRGAVTVDMATAIDIHKASLRAVRAPMLEALDVEWQRADEVSDSAAKALIATKKQELRDITKHPSLVAAQTVEDLLSVRIS